MPIKLIRMMDSYTDRLLRGRMTVEGDFSRPRLAAVKASAEQLVKVIEDCLKDTTQFNEDRKSEMDKIRKAKGFFPHGQ